MSDALAIKNFGDLGNGDERVPFFGACRDYGHMQRMNRWDSSEKPRHDGTPATVIIVHLSTYGGARQGLAGKALLMCPKHAASIRAQKTKGTVGYEWMLVYSVRDGDFSAVTPESVQWAVDTAEAAYAADRKARADAAKAYYDAHIGQYLVDRLAVRDHPGPRVTLGEERVFQTGVVHLHARDFALTPGEARALADSLNSMADLAEKRVSLPEGV